jgi:hypothetical protein
MKEIKIIIKKVVLCVRTENLFKRQILLHATLKNRSLLLTESRCLSEFIIERSNAYDLKNSVALVRERTIPTERPPLISEVIANFCR